MSRYTVTLLKDERTDDEAVVGFDPPLRTFFLQGYEVCDLEHAVMIALLAEAGHRYEPSIVEKLGFIR